jgi:DNA-binding CsgD family transcriptional regulator
MLRSLPGITLRNDISSGAEYAGPNDAPGAAATFVSPRALVELRDGALLDIRAIVVAASFDHRAAREAIDQGAMGLLPMSAVHGELLAAARKVSAGHRYISRAVAACLGQAGEIDSLTNREYQILESLAHGKCNKTIAKDLGIAVGTVKAHVKAILLKLDVTTRTQAALLAAQNGMVSSIVDEDAVSKHGSTGRRQVVRGAKESPTRCMAAG